jgi:hypothetical protein
MYIVPNKKSVIKLELKKHIQMIFECLCSPIDALIILESTKILVWILSKF